ncbi:hypothetical protein [Paracoccus marcusii]|uniref:hypothetical protein n=1 Tax=Paracoccus marcusii TaxID=59779 RepID=UPI0039C8A8D1
MPHKLAETMSFMFETRFPASDRIRRPRGADAAGIHRCLEPAEKKFDGTPG